MTQAELEREIAQVTGETSDEIRRRGFRLMVVPRRKPRVVNWDRVQQARRAYAAVANRRRLAAA
jgi:hypothetical protein